MSRSDSASTRGPAPTAGKAKQGVKRSKIELAARYLFSMTTETLDQPAGALPSSAHFHKPVTDAQARRDISRDMHQVRERAAEIRQAPQDHRPKLVTSEHVRGTSLLDKIADGVNRFCGSMWVFIGITCGIVAWLFLGNVVGFDKTPWPLLLTILNLPQLSIMISLQVSANRAQAASDKRAIADHETLIALHEMARQQIQILHQQDKVLAILNNFASNDMPGRQQHIQTCVDQILAAVAPGTAGPGTVAPGTTGPGTTGPGTVAPGNGA